MGHSKVRGQFLCICISFLPLMQMIWELRSTNCLSHSPYPLPDTGPFPKQDESTSSQFFLTAFFEKEKFTLMSLPAGSRNHLTFSLILQVGPALGTKRQPCAYLDPTPFAQLICSSSPEHFTWLIEVGRGTECKSPKPQAWGGSLWKQEREPQPSGSVILRHR